MFDYKTCRFAINSYSYNDELIKSPAKRPRAVHAQLSLVFQIPMTHFIYSFSYIINWRERRSVYTWGPLCACQTYLYSTLYTARSRPDYLEAEKHMPQKEGTVTLHIGPANYLIDTYNRVN